MTVPPAIKSLFGKKNDCVATPQDFYEELNREFNFKFDPCPEEYVNSGLDIPWESVNYVNPPYSEVEKWVKKAINEMEFGRKSILLIPARTNNKYWRDLVFPNCSEIRFIYNGIKFGEYKRPLRVPLAIVIFDPITKSKNKIVKSETYTYITVNH